MGKEELRQARDIALKKLMQRYRNVSSEMAANHSACNRLAAKKGTDLGLITSSEK